MDGSPKRSCFSSFIRLPNARSTLVSISFLPSLIPTTCVLLIVPRRTLIRWFGRLGCRFMGGWTG
ncbi:hypothetical protein BD309DRAFT_971908 [Dichomitus squalens]|nr:hypothetical protein BD309DRAFT_971908 [Dichomitus squalens]